MRHALVVSSLVVALGATDVASAGVEFSARAGTFKMVNLASGSEPVRGPVIRVAFDPATHRYTRIMPSGLDFPLDVTMHCAGLKWGGAYATLTGTTTYHPRHELPYNALGKSPIGLSGTAWVSFDYHPGAGVGDPIAICNSGLDRWLDQDQRVIAQKGWATRYDNAYVVEAELQCWKEDHRKVGFGKPPQLLSESVDVKFPAWVHCLPGPAQTKPAPGPTPKVVGLQSFEVWINPSPNADYHGPCPKTLTFGGKAKVVSTQPYTLHYRYRTADGDTSPTFETTFEASGEKILHSWQKTFGGGGPAAGTFKTAGGPSGPQVINGWVELEIVDPQPSHQVPGTHRGNHRLTCEQPAIPSGQFQSPGSGPPPGTTPAGATALAAPVAKPDLRILSATPYGSSGKALQATVANVGRGASVATRLKLFYRRSGHTVTSLAAVPALPAGQKTAIVIESASPLAAASSLDLRVDDPSANDETDEGNNTFKVK